MSTLMDFGKKNKALVSEHFLGLRVVEKIFEIMEEKKITQSQLAKKMKLSKSQVSRLLSEDRNLTLSSIAKIFYALGEEAEILAKSQIKHQRESQLNSNKAIHIVVPYEKMLYTPGGKSIQIPRSHNFKNICIKGL